MSSKYAVKIKGVAGDRAQSLQAGKPNVFADPGCSGIELVDTRSGRAPSKVLVKRAGDDLHVMIEDAKDGNVELVFTSYYPEGGAIVGVNEAGQVVEYLPSEAATGYAGLTDGASAELAPTGGEVPLDQCAAPTGAGAGASALGGWGVYALGGLAVLGLASAGHGGSGNQPSFPWWLLLSRSTTPTISGFNDPDGDGRPSVNGRADPGATITVKWPDGSESTTTADGNGNWSVESGHSQGNGEVTAVATNPGKQPSEPAKQPYTDTTPPGAPHIDGFADPDHDGAPTVSGTAEAGATVVVKWPDGSTTTTTADGNGHFESEAKSPQPNGEVSATATDPAGNTSQPGIATYTDTMAPAAPVISGFGDPDRDGHPTVTGTAEPNSTVTITWPDGSHTTTKADGNGDWSSEAGAIQADGTVKAVATDVQGNTSDPTTATYHDTVAPAAPIIDGFTDGDHDGIPTASGKAEPGSTVTVHWPDGSTTTTKTDSDGNWSTESSKAQPDGKVTATATDSQGNTSEPGLAYYDDTTAPDTPNTPTSYDDNVGPVKNTHSTAVLTDDASPGLNIGAGLTDKPSLYVDGKKVDSVYDPVTGTLTPKEDLKDGTHKLSFTLTDPAGNESNLSGQLTLTVDTSPPTGLNTPYSYDDNYGPIVSTTSTAPVTDDRTPGINIGVGITDTPELYIDGHKVPSVYDPTTGTLTPLNDLADGDYVITYTLTDPANNESDPSVPMHLTIDRTPPSAPTSAPTDYDDNVGAYKNPHSTQLRTDDGTPGFNVGPLPSGVSAVELYVDGTKVAATYDNGVLTPDTPLAEGQHTIGYGYVDAAGNSSGSGPTRPLFIDLTPPAANTVLITSAQDDTGIYANDFLTNDPTLVFSGTLGHALQSDEQLQIRLVDLDNPGNTTVWTAAAVTGSAWTFDNRATTLPQGNYSIEVRIVDDVFHVGATASQHLTVHTTGPDAGNAISSYEDDVGAVRSLTSVAPLTDDNIPEFNIGDLPAGVADAVLYMRDATNPSAPWVVVPATYDNATDRLVPKSIISDGSYEFTYAYVDSAGNEGPKAPPFALAIDSTPPGPNNVHINSITDDTGVSASDFVTSDSVIDINGTLDNALGAGEHVEISLDGGTTWTWASSQPAVGATAWTHSGVTLSEGTHDVMARVSDGVNPPVGLTSQEVVIDRTAIAAPTTAPQNYIDDVGAYTSLASTQLYTDDGQPGINLTGPFPPDATRIVLYVNNVLTPATWTPDPTNPNKGYLTPNTKLPDGDYQIAYGYEDTAGNLSGPGPSMHVIVDTVNPVANVIRIEGISQDTGVSSTDFITSDPTLVFNGSLAHTLGANEVVQVRVDGGAWVNASTQPGAGTTWSHDDTAMTLGSGSHNVEARIVDLAMNVGNSTSQTVTVDTSAPTTPVSAPTSYLDNIGTITGTSTAASKPTTDDPTPGIVVGTGLTDTPSLYIDGVKVTSTYDPATGVLTPTAALTVDKQYSFTYTLTDTAGNESAQSPAMSLTLDTTPPALTINPTNGGTISGTTDANTVVKIDANNDGVVDYTTTSDAAGKWNISAPLLTSGTTAHVVATDAAGNTSSGNVKAGIAPSLDLDVMPYSANVVKNGSFDTDFSSWTGGGGQAPQFHWASATGITGAGLIGDIGVGVTTTLSQALSGVTAGSVLQMDMLWSNPVGSSYLGPYNGGGGVVFNISYGGVVYATLTTPDGFGPAKIQFLNGASGLGDWPPSDGVVTKGLQIQLPSNVPSSGDLLFSLVAQPSSVSRTSDDVIVDNVAMLVPTGSGTPGTGYSSSMVAGSGAVSISAASNAITDADSSQMQSAHVVLGTGAQPGDHLLVNGSAASSGTLASGISWANTGGDVKFTGAASLSDYQAALKLVQFDTTSNSAATRTVNSTVNDGASDSNVAVTTLSVTAGTQTAKVTGVALTGATMDHAGGNDHAIDTNDVLTYTVNFDHVVNVSTAGGTPQLALNIGGVTKYAQYSGGSGSTSLTFSYTVQDADFDANGVSVSANSLSTNGGAITAQYGPGAATLTHTALADDPNARIDAIDLGAGNGLLIRSVEVEGHWYYAWDKNGDGVHNDVMSFDSVDSIFNHDINGVVNSSVANADGKFGTTEAYRYGELNGLKLALPTYGGPVNGSGQFIEATPGGGTKFPGTAVSGTPSAGANDNPTYDGLLAIWDASNGTGTGANLSGIPAGWNNTNGGFYRSATDSPLGHAGFYFSQGLVQNNVDSLSSGLVALQVL